MALQSRRPAAGLILHRVHDDQSTSLVFGEQLRAARLLAAMGGVGDADDNAAAGSFFSSLKVEFIDRWVWPTRAGARLAIFMYIEVWYNRKRRHWTLGYLPPTDYELQARALLVPNLDRSA